MNSDDFPSIEEGYGIATKCKVKNAPKNKIVNALNYNTLFDDLVARERQHNSYSPKFNSNIEKKE